MSAAGITTRLYDQAIRKKKEKDMATKKREEELAGQVSSWSCLRCGTLHQIGSSERLMKIDKDLFKFKCNSCGYAYEAPLMSFHPTNINSHQSGKWISWTILLIFTLWQGMMRTLASRIARSKTLFMNTSTPTGNWRYIFSCYTGHCSRMMLLWNR